jgi:hypothetical protein
MKRRDFLKGVMAISALTACGSTESYGADKVVPRGKPQASGRQARVVLAGVTRGSSETAIKSAIRESALVASDFSWLGKNDAVFIKPAINSGSSYPSTTSPVAIAAMVALLKEKGAGRNWARKTFTYRPLRQYPQIDEGRRHSQGS